MYHTELSVQKPCRKRQKEQLLSTPVLITMLGNLSFLKRYSTPMTKVILFQIYRGENWFSKVKCSVK